MVDFIYIVFPKLQGAEARFTKRKILLTHSGTRTHDIWIEKPSPHKGREFESRCGQDEFFVLQNLASAPCSLRKPMQMKSTMTYT